MLQMTFLRRPFCIPAYNGLTLFLFRLSPRAASPRASPRIDPDANLDDTHREIVRESDRIRKEMERERRAKSPTRDVRERSPTRTYLNLTSTPKVYYSFHISLSNVFWR